MLDIAFTIGITSWLFYTAKSRGRNPVFWGLIGCAGYLGTILILRIFILPFIIISANTPKTLFGYINVDYVALQGWEYLGLILSIGLGFVVSFSIYRVLLGLKNKLISQDEIDEFNKLY